MIILLPISPLLTLMQNLFSYFLRNLFIINSHRVRYFVNTDSIKSKPNPTVWPISWYKSSPLYFLRWKFSSKTGFISTISKPTNFFSWATLLMIWQPSLWLSPSLNFVPVPSAIDGSIASISNEMWKGEQFLGSRYSMAISMTFPIPNISMWSGVKHLMLYFFKETH